MKHGKGGHQGIIKGYLGVVGSVIDDFPKICSDRLDKGVDVKFFAHSSYAGRGKYL